MNNKKQMIIIGAVALLIIVLVLGVSIYLDVDDSVNNTVNYYDHVADTGYENPSHVEVESYSEISTEQIEAGAVESPEGFEAEPVEPVDEESLAAPIEQGGPSDGNPVVEVTSGPEDPVYVFRNEKLLNEHYEKHGIEMGFASAEEYQAAASAVITNPDSLFKIEADDGDGVYYLEATNEFVILSTDGYIRTYFLPSSGKAYFDRQ